MIDTTSTTYKTIRNPGPLSKEPFVHVEYVDMLMVERGAMPQIELAQVRTLEGIVRGSGGKCRKCPHMRMEQTSERDELRGRVMLRARVYCNAANCISEYEYEAVLPGLENPGEKNSDRSKDLIERRSFPEKPMRPDGYGEW